MKHSYLRDKKGRNLLLVWTRGETNRYVFELEDDRANVVDRVKIDWSGKKTTKPREPAVTDAVGRLVREEGYTPVNRKNSENVS